MGSFFSLSKRSIEMRLNAVRSMNGHRDSLLGRFNGIALVYFSTLFSHFLDNKKEKLVRQARASCFTRKKNASANWHSLRKLLRVSKYLVFRSSSRQTRKALGLKSSGIRAWLMSDARREHLKKTFGNLENPKNLERAPL